MRLLWLRLITANSTRFDCGCCGCYALYVYVGAFVVYVSDLRYPLVTFWTTILLRLPRVYVYRPVTRLRGHVYAVGFVPHVLPFTFTHGLCPRLRSAHRLHTVCRSTLRRRLPGWLIAHCLHVYAPVTYRTALPFGCVLRFTFAFFTHARVLRCVRYLLFPRPLLTLITRSCVLHLPAFVRFPRLFTALRVLRYVAVDSFALPRLRLPGSTRSVLLVGLRFPLVRFAFGCGCRTLLRFWLPCVTFLRLVVTFAVLRCGYRSFTVVARLHFAGSTFVCLHFVRFFTLPVLVCTFALRTRLRLRYITVADYTLVAPRLHRLRCSRFAVTVLVCWLPVASSRGLRVLITAIFAPLCVCYVLDSRSACCTHVVGLITLRTVYTADLFCVTLPVHARLVDSRLLRLPVVLTRFAFDYALLRLLVTFYTHCTLRYCFTADVCRTFAFDYGCYS